MKKLSAFFALMTVALATALGTNDKVKPVVSDQLEPATPATVRLGGYLGSRINECLEHGVMAQPIRELVQPFAAREDVTEWRGEFWGKWITSAEYAYAWNSDPKLKSKVESAVDQLLQTQTAEGYLGAYNETNRFRAWDVWGRKYTLLGLLGWHAMSGEAETLTAAVRSADYLITQMQARPLPFEHDMWNGMASSSVMEPMVLLYRRTGDERYLDFSRWLLREWEKPYGPDLLRKSLRGQRVAEMFTGPKPVVKSYGDAGKSKAYEMMSCFEGLVELYRVTGEDNYLRAAKNVFSAIKRDEITLIGSGSDWERWCGGAHRQTEPWIKGMETCVTVTWIKFAGQLLRISGDPSYADEIELATYNALLGALGKEGDWWCHHTPLNGTKERAPEQCNMHQNCCVASGPRGLMLLPHYAVMQSRDGVAINFLGPVTASVKLPSGRPLRIVQDSSYPEEGNVSTRVEIKRPEEFRLSIRIPAWAVKPRVKLNGQDQGEIQSGSYWQTKRRWKDGDTVTVEIPMQTRVIRSGEDPGVFALRRGPVVLARDARLEKGTRAFSDLPEQVSISRPAIGREPFWMVFEGTFDGGSIALCDAASAGSTWDTNSAYQVWFTSR